MFFPEWLSNKLEYRKDSSLPENYHNKKMTGRMSLLPSVNKIKGSATVEALLVLPIMFSFVMFLISIIEAIGIHSKIGSMLAKKGTEFVSYSYAFEEIALSDDEEETSRLMEKAGEYILTEGILLMELEGSGIYDRIENPVCLVGTIREDDGIDISISYNVKPIVRIPGYEGIFLTNRFYSKKYTGYRESIEECEMVYITKESEVYHTQTDCRALKTTIESVSLESLDSRRNMDGKIYYSCDKCRLQQDPQTVYITPYGITYHTYKECPGLTLDLYKIPFSEIGDRRKCFYCK